jgi:hypothetical protein
MGLRVRLSPVFYLVPGHLCAQIHVHALLIYYAYKVVWWGHPDTTPSLSLDVFVGLDDELSSADDQYLEQLARMRWLNTAPFAQNYAPEWTDDDNDDANNSGNGEADDNFVADSDVEGGGTAAAMGSKKMHDAPATFGLGLLLPLLLSPAFDSAQMPVLTAAAAAVAKEPKLQPHVFLVLGRLFKLHPDFDAIVSSLRKK